jgi:uncharacterized protein (DUF2141 family)
LPLTLRPAAVFVSGVLLACAGGGAPGPAPAEREPIFRPAIAPFPVADTAGAALDLPFVGGFNAPRPQLVDADGDGDLDLFVQEVTGSVALFERDGEAGGLPRFVFRTAKYGDLDVGEWYRFADVDADGDLDLLAEQPFSYIKYYRNEGERGAYRFVLAADTLKDAEGTPIFSDRQNIPQLGDLDCNGRSDLLIGRLDGTVARYEAMPAQPGRAPAFRLVASEFEGIRILGQQVGPPMPGGTPAPGPSMHGANTMALADHDGDGDLDLFWGDFFEPGLLLIPNRGTCPAPSFRSPPAQFPLGRPLLTSGYNAPTFGDLSGDGKADLVVGVLGGAYNPLRTSAENLYYLGRDTGDEWTVLSRRLLPVLDIGSEAIPALADLDGDGDLDLLLGNKLDPSDLRTAFIYRLENVGSADRPSFRMRAPLELGKRFHAAPALGDLDDDGRLDLILGQWGPRLAWYRGTARGYEPVDSALVTITRGSNTVPTLGDLDGDGDLDLMVGESSGWLNYYRNDGGPSHPRFALVSDEFEQIRIGRRSAPLLADLDGDGDLDLLVGSEVDGLGLFRNAGTRTAPRLVRDTAFRVEVPALAAPAAGDLDGDGDLDLLVGGAGGGAVYLEQR